MGDVLVLDKVRAVLGAVARAFARLEFAAGARRADEQLGPKHAVLVLARSARALHLPAKVWQVAFEAVSPKQ